MTPADLRRIRQQAGLSLNAMARLLRIADLSTIHRWETGERRIGGPATIVLELLDSGELPERFRE